MEVPKLIIPYLQPSSSENQYFLWDRIEIRKMQTPQLFRHNRSLFYLQYHRFGDTFSLWQIIPREAKFHKLIFENHEIPHFVYGSL